MESLDVRLFNEHAGVLEEEAGGAFRFTYAPTWATANRPPLSQSLPVKPEPHEGPAVRAFFAGLLPEGDVRRTVARRFHISATNDFALLAAIGGDCAGAVTIRPPEQVAGERLESVEWLSEDELVKTLAELHERPLLADPEGEIRLSLAGAQDKLPVVVEGSRIGVPAGGRPSTHIIKVPIERFDDTVANEAYCLSVARDAGLTAADAVLRTVDSTEFLLITRFDRVATDNGTLRLHQEDFCQALGFRPDKKYEAEGGPTLNECAELIRAASSSPAEDLVALVDAVGFNMILGNHDAHGKNFSLLYRPDDARLAPLYDLVSTLVYPGLSRKMAMKIGGEYRPDYVERRHVERFAGDAGLGKAAVRNRLRLMAVTLPDVAENVAHEFRVRGTWRPVIGRIVDLAQSRGKRFERALKA